VVRCGWQRRVWWRPAAGVDARRPTPELSFGAILDQYEARLVDCGNDEDYGPQDCRGAGGRKPASPLCTTSPTAIRPDWRWPRAASTADMREVSRADPAAATFSFSSPPARPAARGPRRLFTPSRIPTTRAAPRLVRLSARTVSFTA
jgi:hypothetical protein